MAKETPPVLPYSSKPPAEESSFRRDYRFGLLSCAGFLLTITVAGALAFLGLAQGSWGGLFIMFIAVPGVVFVGSITGIILGYAGRSRDAGDGMAAIGVLLNMLLLIVLLAGVVLVMGGQF
jgi:hypothetical protein